MRNLVTAMACVLATTVPTAAQQSETFARKVPLGANGSVTVSNISGTISITAGPGDEVSIDATKRTTGNRQELSSVQIQVDAHPGRVDISTVYPNRGMFDDAHVSVDYTIHVPASAAVEARSVSGPVDVSGIKGGVRAQTVSGPITISGAAKIQTAKTVSGAIALTDDQGDESLALNTISGDLRLTRVEATDLDLHTISGQMELDSVTCTRLASRSISGPLRLTGPLPANSRYEIHSHSGSVAMRLPARAGFELDASSFSGSIRSAFAMTVGGDLNQNINGPAPAGGRGFPRRPGRGSIRATVGDGSAKLSIDTFSGDIVLSKQ
jgi:DUF4097 and DUF4098 domain-containing protein YvlB